MDLNKERATHNDAKRLMSKNVCAEIQNADTPLRATQLLLAHDPIQACAIIDSVNIIAGALLLCALQLIERDGLNTTAEERARAVQILERTRVLELEASKGPVYARNKHFRETGQFFI